MCRSWWIQLIETIQLDNVGDMMISSPYKWAGNDLFGVSICTYFQNPFLSKSQQGISNNNTISICLDLALGDMMQLLDNFNKQTYGYFFIVRVGSDIPIYYPMVTNFPYFANIQRFEFDNSIDFYLEELINYKFTVNNFIENYDYITEENALNRQSRNSTYNNDTNGSFLNYTFFDLKTDPRLTGSYSKNKVINYYNIFPINMYMNESNPNASNHVMSLIYITQYETIKNTITEFQKLFYPRLFVSIFLFCLFGIILILISWHLITSISNNIVNPIKNLKKLIQDMSLSEKLSSNVRSNQNNTTSYNNTNQNMNLSLKEKNESEDNEEVDLLNGDDELINKRSEEMDKLFNILLDLKYVLSFTSTIKKSSEKGILMNYINSDYTFKEVNNLKGK